MVVVDVLKAVTKIGPKGWIRIVPLVTPAVLGTGAGVKGTVDMAEGFAIRKRAQRRLDEAATKYEGAWEDTERVLLEYGAFRTRVREVTVLGLADWLERKGAVVGDPDVQQVEVGPVQALYLPRYVVTAQDVQTKIRVKPGPAGLGGATASAARWGIGKVAHAGTGAPMRSLRGAPLERAMKAWWAGGPEAKGAGGMRFGGPVSGVVEATPGLVIVGVQLLVAGAGSKSEALDFDAAVDQDVKQMATARDELCAGTGRVEELRVLLGRLADHARSALEALEALEFDPQLHEDELSRAYQVIGAAREVLDTQVFDPESGALTDASGEVLRKYAGALPTQ